MLFIGVAADLVFVDDVAAFIGPGCTYALDPVARLAGYWNIPIVTGIILEHPHSNRYYSGTYP